MSETSKQRVEVALFMSGWALLLASLWPAVCTAAEGIEPPPSPELGVFSHYINHPFTVVALSVLTVGLLVIGLCGTAKRFLPAGMDKSKRTGIIQVLAMAFGLGLGALPVMPSIGAEALQVSPLSMQLALGGIGGALAAYQRDFLVGIGAWLKRTVLKVLKRGEKAAGLETSTDTPKVKE